MVTTGNLDPIALLAPAGLGLHLCLAVAFCWHALRVHVRWAGMFALASTLQALWLLCLLAWPALPPAFELLASASVAMVCSLALTDGSLQFLRVHSHVVRRATLMAVFVLGAVSLMSVLDGGLRSAEGWWLVGAISLPLGLLFLQRAGRERGIGHGLSSIWLLCVAALVAGTTIAGAVHHPLTGAVCALLLGLLGLQLLRTDRQRRLAGRARR